MSVFCPPKHIDGTTFRNRRLPRVGVVRFREVDARSGTSLKLELPHGDRDTSAESQKCEANCATDGILQFDPGEPEAAPHT